MPSGPAIGGKSNVQKCLRYPPTVGRVHSPGKEVELAMDVCVKVVIKVDKKFGSIIGHTKSRTWADYFQAS